MADEERKKKAINTFLGDGAVSDQENAYVEKLQKLFPRNLAESSRPDFNALRSRIFEARKEVRAAKLKKLRWQMPALAAAACLMVAIGIRYVIAPAGTRPDVSPLDGKSFSLQREVHEKSVDIFYREGQAVRSNLEEKHLVIEASGMNAMFAFSPNDAIRQLTVRTPHGEVVVIGTEFIVDSQRDGMLVAVRRGAVRVTIGGRGFLVGPGELLSHQSNEKLPTVSVSTSKTNKRFQDFLRLRDQSDASLTPTDARIGAEAKPNNNTSTTLMLRSGAIIKGYLEFEDGDSVRLRVPATGKVLTFMKSDILERK